MLPIQQVPLWFSLLLPPCSSMASWLCWRSHPSSNGHHQVLYHHPPPHTSSTIQKDYFNNAEVYHLRSSVKPRSLVLRLSADTFKVCRSAFKQFLDYQQSSSNSIYLFVEPRNIIAPQKYYHHHPPLPGGALALWFKSRPIRSHTFGNG